MSNTKKYKYMNGHLKMDPYLKKRINKLYNQDPDRFREMIGAPQRKRKAKGGLIQGFPKLTERSF